MTELGLSRCSHPFVITSERGAEGDGERGTYFHADGARVATCDAAQDSLLWRTCVPASTMRATRWTHANLPPMRPGSLVIGLALSVTLAVPATSAIAQGGGMQIPEKFENLKVLPKDIPRDTLIAVMRGFSMSLGVRCTYCHVEARDSTGAERLQFAKDDKPAKEKARAMMRMVGRINGELLPTVPDRRNPPVNVNCLTCHRTMPVPQTLVQVLDSAMLASGSAGADSTVALYRRLRASDGARGRWDFG